MERENPLLYGFSRFFMPFCKWIANERVFAAIAVGAAGSANIAKYEYNPLTRILLDKARV